MRRGDFHRAGSQFGLRPDVGDERDFPVLNRQHDHSAVFRHFRQSRQQRQQFHPTFCQVCQLRFNFRLFLFRGFCKVFRPLSFQRVVDFRRVGMDGNGSVPEHGFRSGRCDGNVFRFARLRVDDRVFHVPEMPLNGLAEHFVVADCGLQVGVPVDELLAAINEVFLEERKECVSNGFGAAFVQREALTAPVARRAHALELSRNSLFVRVFPRPDSADQPFPPEFVPGQVFFFLETLFDHRLRRDAGVVCAGHPEGFKPHHAVHTNLSVLKRVVQGVPEVQSARYVRRRNDNRIRLFIGVRFGVKTAVFFPDFQPALFR